MANIEDMLKMYKLGVISRKTVVEFLDEEFDPPWTIPLKENKIKNKFDLLDLED